MEASSVSAGGQVKGTNMCILILAMFIASIGYGLITYDVRHAKSAFFGLLFQVVFCILTSTIYFCISPITTASSELLARTQPTIWDVLIACFGGFTGVIGVTRKEKTNVIPGVAIATALMPPLCTAGYGIANHSWKFFLGAMYLFFINSFFICLTTMLILKFMHTPKIKFITKKEGMRQRIYVAVICVITVIPSIYLGYDVIESNVLSGNYNSYMTDQFNFADSQVVAAKLIQMRHG